MHRVQLFWIGILYGVAANCGVTCGRSTVEGIRIISVIARDNREDEDNDFEEHKPFTTTTSTGI
jgi:hypothetical protein